MYILRQSCTGVIKGGGGVGGRGDGTHESVIHRGSSPRSKPFPFYIPCFTELG